MPSVLLNFNFFEARKDSVCTSNALSRGSGGIVVAPCRKAGDSRDDSEPEPQRGGIDRAGIADGAALRLEACRRLPNPDGLGYKDVAAPRLWLRLRRAVTLW